MKIALIVLASLAAVVFVIATIGALLPREHTSRRTISLEHSSTAVIELLNDLDATPSWRSDVTRIEHLPDVDGRRRWKEHHGRDAILYEADDWRPGHWTARIADPTLPYGGTWTWQVSVDEVGGAIVTITEHGDVRNPIFRFMSRFVFGHTATQDKVLRALGAHFGETVTPH